MKEVEHLNIILLEDYINTDTKIKYKCKHGENEDYPWSLIKHKYCCSKGYHEQRIPKHKVSIEKRIEQIKNINSNLDTSLIELNYIKKYNGACLVKNLKCVKHNLLFDQLLQSLLKGYNKCPKCKNEMKSKICRERITNNTFGPGSFSKSCISKKEKSWLNSLNVPKRQYRIPELGLIVDGYNPATNTVYLFHGKFWHGCPKTYNPDYVNPVNGKTMKELYQKTLDEEMKIKDNGYYLIVKWED